MSRYAYTDLISKILDRPVHERSQNFLTNCIFHDDRVPSLSIDLDRGFFYCFGCPEKGGIWKLAGKQGQELDEIQVALQAYESTSNQMYEERRDFADLAKELRRNLYSMAPQEVTEYIVRRDLDPRVVKHFGLGWKPFGNCIAYPYYDDESVAGIKYRPKVGKKFMETGSRRVLYNINDLRGRPNVILAEGESDAHAVWSKTRHLDETWGIGAIPGASMTKTTFELWGLDIFWAKSVYLAFDADDAGDKAAEISTSVLNEKAIRVRPTKGKDITLHLLNGGTLQEIGIP